MSGEPWINSRRTDPRSRTSTRSPSSTCPRPAARPPSASLGPHTTSPPRGADLSIAAARSWTRNPTWNNCPRSATCDERSSAAGPPPIGRSRGGERRSRGALPRSTHGADGRRRDRCTPRGQGARDAQEAAAPRQPHEPAHRRRPVDDRIDDGRSSNTMRVDPERPTWTAGPLHPQQGPWCRRVSTSRWPTAASSTSRRSRHVRRAGSRFGMHPCRNHLPGVETSTGSLGHGLGRASGWRSPPASTRARIAPSR